MAINTAGYIEVCEYSIDSYTERLSAQGKILKNAFKMSPSASVVSSGKVIIDDNPPSDATPVKEEPEQEKEQDNKQGEENKEDGKEQSSDGNTQSSENKDDSNESYNYSVLEAYLGMHPVFEDEPTDSDSKDTSDSGDADDKQSETDNTESDKPKEDDKKEDDKKEDNTDENVFKPGSHFYIQVLLPREGCTIWHIQLDSRADSDAVLKAIKSKKFKSAHAIASKGLGHDGLIALSATTYLYKQADAHAPFIGQCRYAMDSGSEDTNEDADTVVIAIAPIDGRTGKPNEKTVYKAVYNMVGDITDGELEKALKKADSSSDDDEDDGKEVSNKDLLKALKDLKDNNRDGGADQVSISDQVSKWLNSKFKCVGDAGMFDNFLKLREFVENQVAAKNLEYIKDESETPAHYAKVSDVKKSLIYY